MLPRKPVTSFAARALPRLALVALVAGGEGRLALAEPEPAPNQPTITWQAPAGCPDAAAFERLVARYLGDSTAAARVWVTVTITANDGGFHLTWRMKSEDGSGERTLDGPDCGLVAETAALTLALAIDPDAGATDPVDEAAIFHGDDERPPDRMAPVPEPIGIDQPAPGPARYLGVAVRMMGGATLGALPGLAPSLSGALAARSRRWRVELGGGYWFEQRATLPVPVDEPQGGDFVMYAGTFRVCADLAVLGARIDLLEPLSLCLGIELGAMRGAGFGFSLPETHSVTWVGATATLAFSHKIANHLFFRADVEIGRQDRPKFVLVTNGVVIHRPSFVNARLLTGLELQFL